MVRLIRTPFRYLRQLITRIQNKDNPELVTFRESNALCAIVFIHGFSGHASNTWGSFPGFLAEDPRLTNWDIYGLGYPSSLRVDIPGVWSADPDLNVLALELCTALRLPPLNRYRGIALIAHSMGGLVAQRAVLEGDVRSRVSHLLLFGTPSGGLRKATLGALLKRQASDMSSGSAFITKLRADWIRLYGNNLPFETRVIAGDRDQFVPPGSSLAPFPDAVQAVIPGDHVSMVKPQRPDQRAVSIVIETLRGTGRIRDLVDAARLAVERREFHLVVETLQPHEATLDDNALVDLALALDGLNRGPDALALLERRYDRGKATTTDVMGVLAGRLKRRWLVDRTEADFNRARNFYSNALALAEENGDADQAMYHAINIAFLDTMVTPEASAIPNSAANYARRALSHAENATPGKWCEATRGEAHLILHDLETASEAYRRAVTELPSPREVDSIYAQAVRLAGRVFGLRGIKAIESIFRLDT